MSYRLTELPYMYGYHRDELRSTFLKVLRENEGNVRASAAAFDVAERIFYGYLYKLDLMDEVQHIRDEFREARRLRRGARSRRLDTTGFRDVVRNRPDEARRIMSWCYTDAGKDVSAAAQALGITSNSFKEYAEELDILPETRVRPKRRPGESDESFETRFRAWRQVTGQRVDPAKKYTRPSGAYGAAAYASETEHAS